MPITDNLPPAMNNLARNPASQRLLEAWEQIITEFNQGNSAKVGDLFTKLRFDIIKLRQDYQINSYYEVGLFPAIIQNREQLLSLANCLSNSFDLMMLGIVTGLDFANDRDFLIDFLKSQLTEFVNLRDAKSLDQKKNDPCLARLSFAMNHLLKLHEENELDQIRAFITEHNITDKDFWDFGFTPAYITAVTTNMEKLKLLNNTLLQSVNETLQGSIQQKVASLNKLSPEELYITLCESPGKLIEKAALPENGEHKDIPCCIAKYSALQECHCREKFARGAGNLRDITETYLVNFVKEQYRDKTPKVAILGAGSLFQAAVIAAKLFQYTELKSLDLDLVDPSYFDPEFMRNQHKYEITQQFVKLLLDMGFDLNLGPNATALYQARDPSKQDKHQLKSLQLRSQASQRRGEICIEFHNNSNISTAPQAYKQEPDIVFSNDNPVSTGEIKRLLTAQKPQICINANFKKSLDPLDSSKPTIYVGQKRTDQSWVDLVTDPISANPTTLPRAGTKFKGPGS